LPSLVARIYCVMPASGGGTSLNNRNDRAGYCCDRCKRSHYQHREFHDHTIERVVFGVVINDASLVQLTVSVCLRSVPRASRHEADPFGAIARDDYPIKRLLLPRLHGSHSA